MLSTKNTKSTKKSDEVVCKGMSYQLQGAVFGMYPECPGKNILCSLFVVFVSFVDNTSHKLVIYWGVTGCRHDKAM